MFEEKTTLNNHLDCKHCNEKESIDEKDLDSA